MDEYIDRKLLKKRFLKRLDWLKKDIHDEYSGALYDCCESDIDLIDEIPSADVAPVVDGRWERRHSSWHCTNCGKGHKITVGAVSANAYNYCPNCGAKMDGGARE